MDAHYNDKTKNQPQEHSSWCFQDQFWTSISRILGSRCLLLEPLITHENSKLSKISIFYYFAIIFFQRKLRCCTYPKLERGPAGALFWFERAICFWNFQENFQISNQYRSSGGPPFGPPFNFWKVQHLSFRWNKKLLQNNKNSHF